MSIVRDKSLWPPDIGEFVFVGHALDRFGTAETWRALRSGKIQAGVTVVGANDPRTPILVAPLVFHNAGALLYENQVENDTLETLDRVLAQQIFKAGQINFLDRHPGTAVRHRRRIPVPHWLYVTRQSLDVMRQRLAQLEAAQSRRKGSRHASDDDLVAEGAAGIKRGRYRNARRAALELASRAQGASPDAKVDRLARKIKKAIGE